VESPGPKWSRRFRVIGKPAGWIKMTLFAGLLMLIEMAVGLYAEIG